MTDWIREINLLQVVKQCTMTLCNQLLSLCSLLCRLLLQSPTRMKPINWLESARNKKEHGSDKRSKCSSLVILLSSTDLEKSLSGILCLRLYLSNTFFFKLI